MPTRNYQSIGEVLVTVKTEFPDITISKIRFLESEGLIEPERTPSGYRKFYEKDLERLRAILKMQRDEYLPLKVIKDRLLQQEVSDGDVAEGEEAGEAPEPPEELAEPPTGLQMSIEEMSAGATKSTTFRRSSVTVRLPIEMSASPSSTSGSNLSRVAGYR